jgi:hypothetical protein
LPSFKNQEKNNMKNMVLMLLSTLSLVSLPMLSQADSCADVREEYLECIRASMGNGSCDSDISIPPECLKSVNETIQNYNSSSESGSNFFDTKKETTPFVYQADLPPKKIVQVINVKPTHGKIYLETEDDVNQYSTKIKNEMFEAIKEGKRIRLQFE